MVPPGSFLSEGRAQDYADISKIPSKRRNEAIANTLTICGLMQRYGSGFEKILEEYKPYEKEFQPKITSEQSWFTITFMDVAYTNKESLVNSTLQLLKMQNIVYTTILDNPGINKPQICTITGVSDGSAKSN
nr:ATP-binding protein [Amedibacterium intestinale]